MPGGGGGGGGGGGMMAAMQLSQCIRGVGVRNGGVSCECRRAVGPRRIEQLSRARSVATEQAWQRAAGIA